MSKLIDSFNKYRTGINKYYFTLLVFVLLTFFIGDSTILHRFRYDHKIRELQSEINSYRQQIEDNQVKLNSLRMDNESLERFAREQFLMTKPDEDLYIIMP